MTKKRELVLVITDQCNIDELRRKITREYANHIYAHRVVVPEGNIYPFQIEDYPDDE